MKFTCCTIALSVLALLSAPPATCRSPSPCEVNPNTKTITKDGRTYSFHANIPAGMPQSARHSVRLGVCGSYLVVSGVVLELAPVEVIGYQERVHTIMGIDAARGWKGEAVGHLRVRLQQDLSDQLSDDLRCARFEPGDECLLFLDRDRRNELVARSSSLAFKDAAILGWRGVRQEVPRDTVFALVDTCAADRRGAVLARRADLIIEGDVDSCWEGDWLSPTDPACMLTLVNLRIHKGAFADSIFRLTGRPGIGCASWPKFWTGGRVLLFLQESEAVPYDLVAGWEGMWQLEDDARFHVGTPVLVWRSGFVPPDASIRASQAPDRSMSRIELEAMLLE